MPANIQLRDSLAITPVNNVNLGTVIPGTPTTPRKLTVVNTGDAAATEVEMAIVPDPIVVNTVGLPVASANGNGTAATIGIYSLTFTLNGAQWEAHVNSGAAINITADAITANSNVITGVDLVFSAALATSNTATVTINSGHVYVEIAPDVSGAPGAYVPFPNNKIINISLFPNVNPFTLTVNNVADATNTLIDVIDSLPAFPTTAAIGGIVPFANSGYGANLPFNDGDSFSDFAINNGQYVGVDYSSDSTKWVALHSYSMSISLVNNWGPAAWRLEGSFDNTNWTTLHTATGHTIANWIQYKKNYYVINSSTAYRYYRLFFTAGFGNSVYYISEIEFLKKSFRISPSTYNYVVVGVLSDGRLTNPSRASVTTTSMTGSKNVLSWSHAIPGMAEIRVYQGAVGAEKMIASLAPTATSYEDKVGSLSYLSNGPNIDVLETFEELNITNPTATTGAMGFRPVGSVAFSPGPACTVFVDPQLGKILRTNNSASGIMEASNESMLGAQGSFQFVFSVPGSVGGVRGYASIGSTIRSETGRGLFIYDNNGLMTFEVYQGNADQGVAMGSLVVQATTIVPDTRYLCTVSWDSTGTYIYMNGTLVHRFTNLLSFATNFTRTYDAARLQVWLARSANSAGYQYGDWYLEEFAVYSQVQTSQDLTQKVAAMSTQRQNYIVPIGNVSSAHVYPFWLRQNMPSGTAPGNQTRTFGVRVIGNTL